MIVRGNECLEIVVRKVAVCPPQVGVRQPGLERRDAQALHGIHDALTVV